MGDSRMRSDTDALIERMQRDPEFHELVRKRSRFAWGLSALMMAIYFGFILFVAFWPQALGAPIGSGVTTIGIPLGLGVIVSAFVLSGVYVRRANTEFDALIHRIIERAK
jgi:uncharacterized membrane protein (DUF485 family)